jgi:hypothetical protein
MADEADEDMSYVGIDNDDQVRRLANALRSENDRRTELAIDFNLELSLPVARDLRDAIRSNTTLACLDINMQDYSTWAIIILSVLLEGVAASTSINKLQLWNGFDAADLIECLRSSTTPIERLTFI